MSSNRPRPNFKAAKLKDRSELPAGLIPNVRLNTAPAVLDYLEKNFQPSCIGVHEREVDAHRRAGEVGLAQRLIATIKFSQENPDITLAGED